jgi:hypothetical protein
MNIVSRQDAGTMTVDQIFTAIVYLVCSNQRLLVGWWNLDLVLDIEVNIVFVMAFSRFFEEQNWGERMFEKSKGIVVVFL